MLTFDELAKELALYSYRPGWTMTLWDDWQQGTMIYIVATVENSYEPGTDVELRISSWVPPMQTRKQFTEWLWWRLKQIEAHECMEWFKRRGEVVYDPHANIDPPKEDVERVWNRQQVFAMQNKDPRGEGA